MVLTRKPAQERSRAAHVGFYRCRSEFRRPELSLEAIEVALQLLEGPCSIGCLHAGLPLCCSLSDLSLPFDPDHMTDALRNALDLELHRLKLAGPTRPQILTGLSTGFRDLDYATGGLHQGELIVLAGTPRAGVTTLALNIAENVALDHDHGVAFVAPDADARRLARLMLAGMARSSVDSLSTFPPSAGRRLRDAARRLERSPLRLETAIATAREAREWIEEINRGREDENRVRLVIVDETVRLAPDEHALGAELKQIAQDLRCTVLACKRIDRLRSSWFTGPPKLADVGGGGRLADAADTVLILYREELDRPGTDREGEADVIVAKHPETEGRVEVLAFMEHYPRFANLWREQIEEWRQCSCGS